MYNANLKTSIGTLKHINNLKKEERKQFVEACSDECIHIICEACYNFLNGDLKLKRLKSIKEKFRPYRFEIRKLASPSLKVKSKRKILSEPQNGGGIFTMLATSLIPAIIGLLSK